MRTPEDIANVIAIKIRMDLGDRRGFKQLLEELEENDKETYAEILVAWREIALEALKARDGEHAIDAVLDAIAFRVTKEP